MISGTIQIVFGICLVIILFIIGFATYNYEFIRAIQESSNNITQKAVPIFQGIKDMNNTMEETYTVVDRKNPSFRDIQHSVNQRSGIEFSYSFWLYNKTAVATSGSSFQPDTISASETVLFVKGSNKTFTYKNVCNIDKEDYKIKCPLVKLENGRTHLTVEFNTLIEDTNTYPEAIKQGYRNVCGTNATWKGANAHKLTIGNLDREEFKEKWVLVTIIIKDTVPEGTLPNRNKAHCSIYLNNFKELDTYVDGLIYNDDTSTKMTTVRENKGNLYLFPNRTTAASGETPKDLMIANLTYYSHAIDQNTIDGIYAAGVPKYTSAAVAASATFDKEYEISKRYNESLTSQEAIDRRNRILPSSS